MKSTSTAHRVHTENPMCSDSTENSRFRFAIVLPVRCQKASSSGSQWSIHRPVTRRRRAVAVTSGPAVAVTRTYLRVGGPGLGGPCPDPTVGDGELPACRLV